MTTETANCNSALHGSWGKTNVAAPSAVFFAIRLVRDLTGLNAVTGLLMSCISSITDIASDYITGGSLEEKDMFFRLGMTVVVPFTVCLAFGQPFPAAVTLCIINLSVRVLLNDYVFKK